MERSDRLAAGGYSRQGRARLHICSRSRRGVTEATGIVGAQVSLGTGSRLAARYRKTTM